MAGRLHAGHRRSPHRRGTGTAPGVHHRRRAGVGDNPLDHHHFARQPGGRRDVGRQQQCFSRPRRGDEAAVRAASSQRSAGSQGRLLDPQRHFERRGLPGPQSRPRRGSAAVRASAPSAFEGYPVDVRPASVDNQLDSNDVLAEAVSSISFTTTRTGPARRSASRPSPNG